MKRLTCLFLLCFSLSVEAFKIFSPLGDYQCEVYEPEDKIPAHLLFQGMNMYYDSYCEPKLHEGITLEDMRIGSSFDSYEEFIADMFFHDFHDYEQPGERYYFQMRDDKKIIGVCTVLPQTSGHYYIDHLGVDPGYRLQGVATHLFQEMAKQLDCEVITLDTRVFNYPAQALYEKLGFKRLESHPTPRKEGFYFHYVLNSVKRDNKADSSDHQ